VITSWISTVFDYNSLCSVGASSLTTMLHFFDFSFPVLVGCTFLQTAAKLKPNMAQMMCNDVPFAVLNNNDDNERILNSRR